MQQQKKQAEAEEDKTFEELFNQITHEKQREFLEQYPKFSYIKKTTEAIGINESTPYEWINKSEPFKRAFQALKKEVTARLIETHEQNIDDVAFDKLSPAQSRIFGSLVKLRALDPQRYRENQPTKIEHEVVHSVRFILPDGQEYKAGELKGTFKELPQHIDSDKEEPQDVEGNP